MDTNIIQALVTERNALRRKLDAIEATIAAYSGDAGSVAVDKPQERTINRAPSEKTLRTKAAVRALLKPRHGTPTPTRNIVEHLTDMGIEVGGKNPVATLSALLSHSDEFTSIGREGWVLSEYTEGSGAQAPEPSSNTGEGDTSPNESKEEFSFLR